MLIINKCWETRQNITKSGHFCHNQVTVNTRSIVFNKELYKFLLHTFSKLSVVIETWNSRSFKWRESFSKRNRSKPPWKASWFSQGTHKINHMTLCSSHFKVMWYSLFRTIHFMWNLKLTTWSLVSDTMLERCFMMSMVFLRRTETHFVMICWKFSRTRSLFTVHNASRNTSRKCQMTLCTLVNYICKYNWFFWNYMYMYMYM